MSTLTRTTLFWKYAAYLSWLVAMLLVLSGAIGGYIAYRQSIATLKSLQRARADFAASEIEGFVMRTERAMRATVAKFDGARSAGDDVLRLDLIALMRHQPAISSARWIGAEGQARLSLSRLGIDEGGGEDDSSSRALVRGAQERAIQFGKVAFRDGSEPYMDVAVGASPHGPVLVAEMELQLVVDVVSRASRTEGATVYVVDSTGRLVSHGERSLVLRNADFSGLPQVREVLGDPARGLATDDARDVAGVRVLSTAAPIPPLGWVVFIEQPLEQAFRPVYASVATSFVLVVVGLAAALAAALALARHMVRPIRDIETGARRIGEGDLAQRIEVKTGDEIEALGEQFNRMAARLSQVNAMQESRIAERTRELALANDAKTRFLAAASHDLRQPMHALSLFAGQLSGVPMPPQGRAIAERIEQSVAALEALMEALLDLSKLDVGAVATRWEDFPLQRLLWRIVEELAPAAEAKGLALTLVPTSLWARSDPLLLERIVRNLVVNAVRYTEEGRVLVGCRRRGSRVELCVADSGIGIGPEHLSRVFDEFYRVRRADDHAPGGLGLGLAIVQRLARLLDHPIEVRSHPDRGTVFRVSLPRASRSADGESPTPERLARDLNGVRVLVVDDEASAREAMKGLLAQWGCEVASTATAEQALANMRCRPVDIVLCDLDLGAAHDDGLRTVSRLRAASSSPPAFAFVTGESTPELLARVRASGYPIAFKPTAPGKLRALIEHLLNANATGAAEAQAAAERDGTRS
jgi:signal transduction histidine kinase